MTKRGNGEGTIYQRAVDGVWCGQVTINRRRKSFYGKTRQIVQQKMRKALGDADRGIMPSPERLTVEAYLIRWLADAVAGSVTKRTHENYAYFVHRHIIPRLGKIKLRHLQPAHLQGLYTALRGQGLAPKTVKGAHGVLHKALDQAVKWDLAPRNVAASVQAPRAERPEHRTFTLEQVKTLGRVARETRWAALLMLTVTTGLRQGELLGLKWADIDLEAGVLQVRRQLGRDKQFTVPKAGSRRRLDLSVPEIQALAEHRRQQDEERERWGAEYDERDLVFATHQGRPLGFRNVTREFKKLLAKAGLEPIRFHDLRHTNATLLLAMGIHPKVVQERLGHSQIGITLDTYSHVLPTLGKDAIERLGQSLEE